MDNHPLSSPQVLDGSATVKRQHLDSSSRDEVKPQFEHLSRSQSSQLHGICSVHPKQGRPFEIQEFSQQPTIRVMTDGHSCQLSQRSVVGIGVAKIEVKDAEDQYAWSTVNIVTKEPDVMASRPGRGCKRWCRRTGYNREDVPDLALHSQMRT